MKKFVAIILVFLLTACTNGNSTLNKLKEDYPVVKEEVEKLPKDVQNELVVPDKLPFDVKNVSIEVGADPRQKTYDHTSFKYTDGKGVILYVTTIHQKNNDFGENQKNTTKLKDGTKVIIDRDEEKSKIIRWKKQGYYREIMLIISPDVDANYTIKDLIKVADSINYN